MKVYLVGHWGPEHNHIECICLNYETALVEFQKLRKKLLEKAKEGKEWKRKEYPHSNIYNQSVERLSETDPKKIDNYPHETPFIEEKEVR